MWKCVCFCLNVESQVAPGPPCGKRLRKDHNWNQLSLPLVLLDGRGRELIDSGHRYSLLSTESGTKDVVQLLLPSLASLLLMLFLGHNLLFSCHYRNLEMLHLMKTVLLLPSLRLEGFLLNHLFFFMHTQGTLDGHFSSYFQTLITSAMGNLDYQATCSMKWVISVGITFVRDHLKSH